MSRFVRSVGLHAVASLLVVLVAARGAADEPPQVPATPANAERLAWWREVRFGIFVHWGPVSLKGTEIGWSRGAQVPQEEYDRLYLEFNPQQFDARAWAALVKQAGARYLVFTTKHHDGFCMFDTHETDFNIMRGPFARDVVKELADACRQEGIAFGTYYSVCDWHHPDFPHGSPGGTSLKPHPDLDRYEQYLRAQVRELITNYGPLLIMWFDVAQDFDAPRGQGVVDSVRSLQPDIIINNRCAVPGDYDTPEQRIGGFNRTRPWETCMTIAQQWAWKPGDVTKSRDECLQTLLRVVGGDGNLLLNVGPRSDGTIEPEQVTRLQEMGAWLDRFGEGVYGTRGGPFKPGRWGAATCKDRQVYLFIMNWPESGPLRLPALPGEVLRSDLLTGGLLQFTCAGKEWLVDVAPAARQQPATVVRLTMDCDTPTIESMVVEWSQSKCFQKPATASNVFQGMAETYGPGAALDDDPDSRWATDAGTASAWLEVDLGEPTTIRQVRIDEAFEGRIRKFELAAWRDDAWQAIFAGAAVGREFRATFPPVTTSRVRLNILEATEGPTIWEFQLF
jgi:alpha-L-fucosidase